MLGNGQNGFKNKYILLIYNNMVSFCSPFQSFQDYVHNEKVNGKL